MKYYISKDKPRTKPESRWWLIGAGVGVWALYHFILNPIAYPERPSVWGPGTAQHQSEH